MADSFPELRPAARILLGPGPSNVHPRVMKAMASPVVGHLDPDFMKVMEDIKRLLRIVFRTENEITFPILSGLGIRGVIFSDAGQSFRLKDSLDISKLQASVGLGVRWKSPFGPLAVDIAFPLNPRPADQSTVFEVGAGSPL